jgi:hypothetical protein
MSEEAVCPLPNVYSEARSKARLDGDLIDD